MSKESNPYKDTVLLPRTDFPMRAGLAKSEPQRLARWEKEDLYRRIVSRREQQGAPDFILHDGPPFANGDVHMGTALNKVLKDLIVKSRTMAGFRVPFVPGWDCHGLPIEFRVVKETGGLDPVEVRERSEAYARKFIDIQRASFRRLGVFGDWDNPYLTLDRGYEAEIIRTFGTLVADGLVYRSRRPVLWSYGAGTALAEAEVEYKDKTSPAVYVPFEAASGPAAQMQASFVIWTTTPWTLPANLGIALNAGMRYLVADFADGDGTAGRYVVAHDLLEAFSRDTGLFPVEGGFSREMNGASLAEGAARHPFIGRESKLITGNFVTAENGTGAVHIAPGHGMDDYMAGKEHGLGLLSPVDDEGKFTDEVGVPGLAGKHVFAANTDIIDLLRERGGLLAHNEYRHSYPFCWRSKTPVIFRSVEQFFIRIDGLRDAALAEIDKVDWVPAWGRNRIAATVASRPDWCISRQRTWGVPLPAFFTAEGETLLDANLVDRVADIIEEEGSGAWFSRDDAWWREKLGLPEGTRRGRDTLDVWIDSGCSSMAVMDRRPELRRPADVYIEATDQHRGWFQSSLMLSVAARGAAPYKQVITHGFVVDNSTGEKISKSGDKPINAEHYYGKYGADIVRLWVASVDFRTEVPFSDELFTQVVETYRRLRNTLRILLANLHDHEPGTPPPGQFPVVDRWILDRLQAVIRECRAAYQTFEFRRVYNAINQFCTHDLSALYVDITKDRLYCDAPDSPRRRATQHVMHTVVDSLCKLLAPILAFTADEAWENLGHPSSVHLADFPEPDPAHAEGTATATVNALLEVRDELLKAVETLRAEKKIGKALEAEVTLGLPASALAALGAGADEVAEFFTLSRITLVEAAGDSPEVTAAPSTHPRCARCWRHLPEVGSVAGHDDLCPRCVGALS